MDKAIEIKNLSVKIDRQPILRKIRVDLPSGKIIGLLGPSGAGKTTLIKTIVGRRRPSKGTVNIFDRQAGDPSLRNLIGYMPQTTSLYLDLTAKENVSYFASIAGLNKRIAEQALLNVGLADHMKIAVSKLSGGQKSRVSLAIALLGSPKLLVLDEPTVGVDPMLRAELWARFRQLADSGITIIVTSHVMDEAEHCDYLMLLKDGKLLAFDVPSRLEHHLHTKTVEQTFIKLETQHEPA